MSNNPNKRLHDLDTLRGLAALGIMVFHYLSWTIGEFEADSPFARIGLYGVSIFYVLSGLTLYHVYQNKMKDPVKDVISFGKRRFFRIFPLMWLVMLSTLLLAKDAVPIKTIALNLTGLFGLFSWDTYLGVGVWSIGNELVFYLLFPLYLFSLQKNKALFFVLVVVTFFVGFYFPFTQFKTAKTLSDQWTNYVNPLTQAYLFLSGILIGVFFKDRTISLPVRLSIIIVSLLLFVLFKADGNPIVLVTGFNRVVFSAICISICLALFQMNSNLPPKVQSLFSYLGDRSYSIYLVHPLLYSITGMANSYFLFAERYRFFAAVALTFVCCHFVYLHFEKRFMKMGR